MTQGIMLTDGVLEKKNNLMTCLFPPCTSLNSQRNAFHLQSPPKCEPLAKSTVYSHLLPSANTHTISAIYLHFAFTQQLVYIYLSSLTCSHFPPSPFRIYNFIYTPLCFLTDPLLRST